jgi:hypothetical protein
VVHATRHARAAAALAAIESKEDHMDLSDGASPAASSSEPSSEPLAPLPSPLLSLLTSEAHSSAAGATASEAGSRLLQREDIWTALRYAMHVQGDHSTRPPKEHRSALASRYLHTRIVVDTYTAQVFFSTLSCARK